MLDSRLSTALRSAQLHSVSLDLPQQEMTFPASCHYTEPNVSSTFGTKELAHASPTFCMQLSFTRVQFDDNVYSALSPVWSFVRFQWSLCAPRIYIYAGMNVLAKSFQHLGWLLAGGLSSVVLLFFIRDFSLGLFAAFFYRLLSSKANVLFDVTPMPLLQRRRETGGTNNSAGLGTNDHTTADLIH